MHGNREGIDPPDELGQDIALVHQVGEPICVDPDPAVSGLDVATNLQYQFQAQRRFAEAAKHDVAVTGRPPSAAMMSLTSGRAASDRGKGQVVHAAVVRGQARFRYYLPIKSIYVSAPDSGMTQVNEFPIAQPARAADSRPRLAARN
jgi:hypothetical protein